jgi:hypothetical protein
VDLNTRKFRLLSVTILLFSIVSIPWLSSALAQENTCEFEDCIYLPFVMAAAPSPTEDIEPTPSEEPELTPTLDPELSPTSEVTPTLEPTPTLQIEPTPTLAPTATPTLPPPSFNACRADPYASVAPNYPIKIVNVIKYGTPENVVLQNVSNETINLDGWIMCSILGYQEHTGISGNLAPGQTRTFAYTGVGNIWNNFELDDGALYNPQGQLVSFWKDK